MGSRRNLRWWSWCAVCRDRSRVGQGEGRGGRDIGLQPVQDNAAGAVGEAGVGIDHEEGVGCIGCDALEGDHRLRLCADGWLFLLVFACSIPTWEEKDVLARSRSCPGVMSG